MALIEYIGKQKNRGDDVLKTSRVWQGAGAVVEVPEDQKAFYLAHPMEWLETTPAAVKKREEARAAAAKNLKEIKSEWDKLTIDDLEGIRNDISIEIAARKAESLKPKAPVSDETRAAAANAAPVQNGKDEASRQVAANRLLQIREGIKSLDPKDPEHFTGEPNKLPRVAAVTEAVGFKVSQEEIKQALELTGK